MTEFNPNCGKCGMLNSRGFCSLTACRYPSNAIVVEPKVIRGMMVNPQIEKPQTNYDRLISKTPEELSQFFFKDPAHLYMKTPQETLAWLKSPVEVDNGT